MKKIIALLMALMLCAAAFTACKSESSQDGKNADVTVEETTILDEQGIKAVVKGYGKYEGELLSFDRELLIDVTNNTEKAISFGLGNCSVNGIVTESHYFFTVEPGKTETCPAVFEMSPLEALGVTTVADYEFNAVVQDNETSETIFESEPISIKTSAYEGFEYNYDESGTVLYDADGVKIIAKDVVEDEFFGLSVNIYIVNTTDKNLDISVAEGTCNSKTADIMFGSTVYAGKRAYNSLSFGEEDRPEKIESLTVSFVIYDWDSGECIVEKTDPGTVTY